MTSPSDGVERLVLDVNGFRFDALAGGPVSGPLVILLHGFPEFADSWLPILGRLAEAGFRAVAVDQRGYSPGARPGRVADYAVDLLVSDVLGFADTFGQARFHLVGHDWGGIVAWTLAARHPGRLASLCVLSVPHVDALLDAIANDPDQQRRSWYVKLFRAPFHIAEFLLKAWNFRGLKKAYDGKLSAPQVEANVRRLREPGALTAALNWYRALDVSARIGLVEVPTLYVWGDRDQALGPVAAHATAAHVSGPYRFEILDGASHWLLEEEAAAVGRLILENLGAKPSN
ncbi:alpha/beta hydrolase [Isosphaeraceae bacterium EP7]